MQRKNQKKKKSRFKNLIKKTIQTPINMLSQQESINAAIPTRNTTLEVYVSIAT